MQFCDHRRVYHTLYDFSLLLKGRNWLGLPVSLIPAKPPDRYHDSQFAIGQKPAEIRTTPCVASGIINEQLHASQVCPRDPN